MRPRRRARGVPVWAKVLAGMLGLWVLVVLVVNLERAGLFGVMLGLLIVAICGYAVLGPTRRR